MTSAPVPGGQSTGVPFGRVVTAMVTPFAPDLSLDLDGVQRLATALVDAGNDGLVINGTAGEASTTTDDEKERSLRAVVEAVGDRAAVIAGVGTNNTAHTIELAKAAGRAGAHGLLVVTPYYNRPPQSGLLAHFRAVADATSLPNMLYDIPVRTGRAIETETLLQLAEHERIVAVKDAKGDVAESSAVMRRCDLAFYSGEDSLTLPLLSVGAVGVVGTSTCVVSRETGQLIDAYVKGDVTTALTLHRRLMPAFTGFFRTQGTILVKAAMSMAGLPGGPVRSPLVNATEAEIAQLRSDLAEAGWQAPRH